MNIFDQIRLHGTDGDFQPEGECKPTMLPPGHAAKIEVMAQRVQNGQPLFNAEDKTGMSES